MSNKKNTELIDMEIKYLDTLGIEIKNFDNGRSTLSMPFNEKLTIPFGMVHGGAIFSLADSACAMAIYSVVDKDKKFLTAEMKINFLEPVLEGDMIASAKILRMGRVIPVEVEVSNNNTVIAKGLATYIIVDQNKSRKT